MKIAALVVLATVGLSQPALADDWPSSGNFDVVELNDSCAAVGEFSFDGRSDVRFFLDYDGTRALIALTSLDWTKPAEPVDITWSFRPTTAYTGAANGVTVDDVYDGFVGSFAPEVLDSFATGQSLLVSRGDTVVTHLNLRGSAAASATIKRCVAAVHRQNAAKEQAEQRWDYIAEDPFAANALSESPSRLARPSVITNPSWERRPEPIIPGRAASRSIASGSATLQCTAEADGSLSSCTVLTESPAGLGFGQAALASISSAKLSQRTISDAAPNSRVVIPIRFGL